MISIFKILVFAIVASILNVPHAKAKSAEKIALITNIETPKNYCCWARICTFQNPDLIKDLDSIYRKRLKHSGYHLETYHNPNQYKLFEVLTSNKFKAIFFVSHSFKLNQRNQNGIISVDRILNNNKVDIKPILKLMRTDYFSFSGCYSESQLPGIIKGYPKKNYDKAAGFSGMVEAKKALKESITKFLKQAQASDSNPKPDLESLPGFKSIKVTANRVAPMNGNGLPVIQILANGELLTMLPSAMPGESQNIEFSINIPDKNYDFKLKKNANLLSIQVSNGYNTMDFTKPIPGEVEFISTDLPGTWKLYRMAATGEAMGHNTNLYQYKY